MLLIDGVKYELWIPKKEVEEFHPLVKEHYKEIFGKNSYFIEGNRLESESGKGSVPDGFVVTLGATPRWHIVEMELSTHQLYDHIVNQVGRFITGVKNTATQKKIIEAIYHYVQDNKQRKAEFEEAIGSGEIYKFLSDLITKPPVLVIIIEERTRELDEALDLLKYSPIEIEEFQTFKRVGAETVHAHLFEPLYKPATPPYLRDQNGVAQTSGFFISLPPSSLSKRHYIHLPESARKNNIFPLVKTTIQIDTDKGNLETEHRISHRQGRLMSSWLEGGGLDKWFDAHPELEVGDTLRITVIEPMKKYLLEIVK